MKKIILVALLMVGTIILAQERNKRQQGGEKNKFTTEQKSQLMLKKITLALDLNEGQQKEIGNMISDKMAKRDAMKKEMLARKESGLSHTSDERFAIASKILDEKIANKKRIQKILNPQQYEKWTAMMEKHHKENRMNNIKGKGNRKGRHMGIIEENQTDSQERKG
jgi:protein CpxP